MAAIDMVVLLTEVAPQVRQLYPAMPVRIIEAICHAIAVFMTDEQAATWVDKVCRWCRITRHRCITIGLSSFAIG